jgi:hypothetical protein
MCFNMEEIIKLDTVGLYNKLYGVETLHPLVSVVDASEIKQDLPANNSVTLDDGQAVPGFGKYSLDAKDAII